jgi:hypothetical protein
MALIEPCTTYSLMKRLPQRYFALHETIHLQVPLLI